MLIFGIYIDNLEMLINKCNLIKSSINNTYFYDLIYDLENNVYNLTENDLYVTQNVINIKKFLEHCVLKLNKISF